jgi:hypothetical protein
MPSKEPFVPELERIRSGLKLVDPERIRIAFSFGTDAPAEWLECIPCDALLEWNHDWWQCPWCGYQVTTREAKELLEMHQKFLESHLQLPQIPKTRRSRWGWLKFSF